MKVKKTYYNLGAVLKEARAKEGITLYSLAFEIGYKIYHQNISKWEQGKENMPSKYIANVARVLKIEPLEIINAMANDYKDYLESHINYEG